MAAVYKIAVIGSWDTVMGFKALGMDVYPTATPEEARQLVHELAHTDCAVIYLTETLAKDMGDVLNKYKDSLTPAIILIPGRDGSLGLGQTALDAAVERAVGINIL